MIIVRLKGGLGNQMFQYAAGRRLAVATNQNLKLDLNFLERGQIAENVTRRSYDLSIFNVVEEFAPREECNEYFNFKNRAKNKLLGRSIENSYVKEKGVVFDPYILSLKGNRYLDGHWMSELYFKDIEGLIRNEFTFKEDLTSSTVSLSQRIVSNNSVCVHVRRGDYVSNPAVQKVYGTIGLSYFRNAIESIKQKVSDPFFYVFSDDIEWCEMNLNFVNHRVFVEKHLEGADASGKDYFQLMTLCKHFIISNSTYGWWAAWLGQKQQSLVYAPKKWFNNNESIEKDIYPKRWQLM